VKFKILSALLIIHVIAVTHVQALSRPEIEFKVFQFPRDRMPRIDGKIDDWDIVPEEYVVGTDQINDTEDGNGTADPKDIDIRVKVGWVKGMNRLYFLYEAYDDYWDFGDGSSSNEQNPIHVYEPGIYYVVTLEVEGPAGKAVRSRHWEVMVR